MLFQTQVRSALSLSAGYKTAHWGTVRRKCSFSDSVTQAEATLIPVCGIWAWCLHVFKQNFLPLRADSEDSVPDQWGSPRLCQGRPPSTPDEGVECFVRWTAKQQSRVSSHAASCCPWSSGGTQDAFHFLLWAIVRLPLPTSCGPAAAQLPHSTPEVAGIMHLVWQLICPLPSTVVH